MPPLSVKCKIRSLQGEGNKKKGLEKIPKNFSRDYEGDIEETSESDNNLKGFNSKIKASTKKMDETDFKPTRKIFVETTSGSEDTDCNNDSSTTMPQGRKSHLSLRSGKSIRRYNFKTSRQWKEPNSEIIASNQCDGHFIFPIKNGRTYNEKTILEVCDRMKQGESSRSIASEIGADVKTVRGWRKKYVPELGPEIRKIGIYDNDTVFNACNRLILGYSVKLVTEKFGIAFNTIKLWQTKYIKDGKLQLIPTAKRFDHRRILEVCERMKQGESSRSIASEIGACVETVRKWRKKYVPELGPEERKICVYDNNTVIEACNRLILGDSEKAVSENFGTDINTVKGWKDKYIKDGKVQVPSDSRRLEQETILELCERMKQGESSRSIAFEIGADVKTVKGWRSKYLTGIEPEIRDTCAYDNRTVLEACNRLIRGDSVHHVSKSFGVDVKIIKSWQTKYIKDGKPELTLRANRFDESIKLKICNRLKRGDSAADLAMEFGIGITNINNWRQKFIVQGLEVTGLKKRYSENTIPRSCKKKKGDDLGKAATKNDNSGCKVIQKSNQDKLVQRIKAVSTNKKEYIGTGMKKQCDRLNQGYNQREVLTKFGISQSSLSTQRHQCVSGRSSTFQNGMNLRSNTKVARNDELCSMIDHVSNDAHLSHSSKRQQVAKSKTFVPLDKVYVPKGLKLQVVKMIEKGVSISKLSKEVNINRVTLKSWMLNKDLLMKQSVKKTQTLALA